MSIFGDLTGQVWFLVSSLIFLTTSIAVIVFRFYVISNYESDRGNLDVGARARLESLETLGFHYLEGAAIVWVSWLILCLAQVLSLMNFTSLEIMREVWFFSGLIAIVFAGLSTAFLLEVSRQATVFVFDKRRNDENMKQPIVSYVLLSSPLAGKHRKDETMKEPVRNSFIIGYVAVVLLLVAILVMVGL